MVVSLGWGSLVGCYLGVRTLPVGIAVDEDVSAGLTQPFHLEVKETERIWALQDFALFDRGQIVVKVDLALLDHGCRTIEG